MKKIKVLIFNDHPVLLEMVEAFKESVSCEVITNNFYKALSFEDERILLVFSTNVIGSNERLMNFIKKIKEKNKVFNKSYAGIIVNSENELYTKTLAQQVVFLLNQQGLSFIGQPMVEIIKDFKNYITWQKLHEDKTLKAIAKIQVVKLAERLYNFKLEQKKSPKILVLHASSYQTSNTLMLWNMIKEYLDGYDINEIEIEDGKIIDCSGCPFETCQHFAQKKSCYYGGVIVDDVLPAIEACDYFVWICPNYNDSISAKLMAVINRMTVLYRRISLKDKTMFAVIISGNSGSDSVAKHLISALNLNKGFILPPEFSIMSIANDSGEIAYVEGIREKAKKFAEKMKEY
ncbi:MAG TPA: NAD(P)H-dependent oxidoreductase [Clostridia bacterium]|nr:NAD(P)H-dependent oxidoreductase [Clostridia bacterium]